jgi:hypothetical protein
MLVGTVLINAGRRAPSRWAVTRAEERGTFTAVIVVGVAITNLVTPALAVPVRIEIALTDDGVFLVQFGSVITAGRTTGVPDGTVVVAVTLVLGRDHPLVLYRQTILGIVFSLCKSISVVEFRFDEDGNEGQQFSR